MSMEAPAAYRTTQCAPMQVLRAMEVRGFILDRQRYKALFAEMCRREEAARRHSDQPPGACGPAADNIPSSNCFAMLSSRSVAIGVGCATAISW
jgi:hypothetical protein